MTRPRALRDRCSCAPVRPTGLDTLEPRTLFSAVTEFTGTVEIAAGVYYNSVFALTVDSAGPISIAATGQDAHDVETEGGSAGFLVNLYPDLNHDDILDPNELDQPVLNQSLDLDPQPLGSPVTDSASGTIAVGDYHLVVQSNYGYWHNALNPNTFVSSFDIDVTLPTPEVQVTGPLGVVIADGDLTADWLDGTRFGTAGTGDTLERTFTVSNTGDGSLTTSNMALSAGFSVVEALDATIAPGASDTFTVAFDTSGGSGSLGEIHFDTNDADEATHSIGIRADVSATPPELVVKWDETTIDDGDTTPTRDDGTDFGTTEVGDTITSTFVLSNPAAVDLDVAGILLPEGFELVDAAPTTVAGEGEVQLAIRLTADAVGTYTGDVVILNSDASKNPYTFAITGTVLEPAPPTDPAVSDFDGVEGNDLVFRWGAMGNTWAVNTQTGAATALPRLVDANWRIAGVGDFDGGRHSSLLFRNAANGKIAIWRMSGTTRVEVINLPYANGWKIGGVADFNGDGQADLFLRNSVDGRNTVWTIDDGQYVSSTLTRPLANRNWIAAGAGDFDADGHGDVLFRNTATGENAIWYFSGTTFSRVANTAALADPNWQVADVKDFDGDGDADIAWRNKATGRNAIWTMNDATREAAATLVALPNPNWLAPGQAEYTPAAAARPAATTAWRFRAAETTTDRDAADREGDSLLALEPLVTLPTIG